MRNEIQKCLETIAELTQDILLKNEIQSSFYAGKMSAYSTCEQLLKIILLNEEQKK